MSRFRTVGAVCDAEDFSDHYCDSEITLCGVSTFADVDKTAKQEGWAVFGGRAHDERQYLCPLHKGLKP